MVLGINAVAIGSLLYFLEIRRPETYLKASRKGRRPIVIIRWIMILALIAGIIAVENFITGGLLI